MKLHYALIALLASSVNLASLSGPAAAQRGGGDRGRSRQDGNAAPQAKGENERFAVRHAERGALFADRLGLTAEQQEQLQALRQQMTSGQRPSAEERAALRQAHRAQLEQILTPEQLAQLAASRADRPTLQRGASHRPFAGAELTEEQRAQMAEIRQQLQASRADRRPFAGLELNEEQQAQMAKIRQQMQAQIQAFRESGQQPDSEQLQALRQAHREAFQNILTEEQRALLAERRRAAGIVETEAASKTSSAIEESSWGEVKEQMK